VPPGRLLHRHWQTTAFLGLVGAGVILVDIDQKKNPTEAEKQAA